MTETHVVQFSYFVDVNWFKIWFGLMERAILSFVLSSNTIQSNSMNQLSYESYYFLFYKKHPHKSLLLDARYFIQYVLTVIWLSYDLIISSLSHTHTSACTHVNGSSKTETNWLSSSATGEIPVKFSIYFGVYFLSMDDGFDV